MEMTAESDYRLKVSQAWLEIQEKMEKDYNEKNRARVCEVPQSLKKAYAKGVTYKAIAESEKNEEKCRRIGRAVGLIYLLLSEAIHLIDEVESMLAPSFANKYGFKHLIKMINKPFDEFCKRMGSLMNPQEVKRFNSDFEAFDANCRHFANLDGWKESSEEDIIKGLHERFLNLHGEITEVGKEYVNRLAKGDSKKAIEIKNSLMAELREMDKEGAE